MMQIGFSLLVAVQSQDFLEDRHLSAVCKPVSENRADAGYPDDHRGWYDVQGCGKCNDYCRWVGNTPVGTDTNPSTLTKGDSWWSCRLAGSTSAYSGQFQTWNHAKCDSEGQLLPPNICESGAFQPDPKKYYIISHGDLHWTHGNQYQSKLNWMTRQNTPNMKLHLGSDKVTSAAHWRFVHGVDGWRMHNRLTGLQVQYNADWRMTTAFDGQLLNPSCNSERNKVLFSMDGVHDAFVRCNIEGCKTNANLNMLERKKHETGKRNCIANDGCWPGWNEVSSTSWFFCTDYRCERYVTVPAQETEQWWSVAEVSDFKRPDIHDAVTVEVEEHALDAVGNHLALAGDLVFMNTPVLGAIFGFAQSEYLSGPTPVARMQKVANDIRLQTLDLIQEGIVDSNVRMVGDRLEQRWSDFMVVYAHQKNDYMKMTDLERKDQELDNLGTAWNNKAGEFAVDMTGYFGNFAASADIRLAQKSFPYLKIAIMEVMTMYQEVLLLEAYVHDDTCDDLVDRYLIPSGQSKALKYKQLLQAASNQLLQRRLDYVGASHDSSMYTCRAYDNFNGATELFYFSGGGASSVYSSARRVAQVAKVELEHDMTYLSYPVEVQMQFLDNFESRTKDLCNKLRNDAAYRTSFEDN